MRKVNDDDGDSRAVKPQQILQYASSQTLIQPQPSEINREQPAIKDDVSEPLDFEQVGERLLHRLLDKLTDMVPSKAFNLNPNAQPFSPSV